MFRSFADPASMNGVAFRDDSSFIGNAVTSRVLPGKTGLDPNRSPSVDTVAVSRFKRAIDVVGAGMLLLFLAPLLVLVALAIRLDSSGPVFFRQQRSGLNGRTFKILKFRTMHVMEDGAVRQATVGDKRVTRIGAFLRRSSVDELPQLLNVLSGEMSLIGPRPHALAHDLEFSRVDPSYHRRFRAKPGLTGLAQVNGFRGEVTSAEAVIGRVKADNEYVDTWSLMLDVKIVVRTALLLVRGDKNAY